MRSTIGARQSVAQSWRIHFPICTCNWPFAIRDGSDHHYGKEMITIYDRKKVPFAQKIFAFAFFFLSFENRFWWKTNNILFIEKQFPLPRASQFELKFRHECLTKLRVDLWYHCQDALQILARRYLMLAMVAPAHHMARAGAASKATPHATNQPTQFNNNKKQYIFNF